MKSGEHDLLSTVGEERATALLSFPPVQNAIDLAFAEGFAEPRYRNLTTDAARWLAAFALGIEARHIVEVGSSNGYSTLHLGAVASELGGRLTSFEKYSDRAALARQHVYEAGLSNWVDVQATDGLVALRERRDLTIDLLFLDIWPADYARAIRLARPGMHPGSYLVADNMLGHRDRLGRWHPASGSGADACLRYLDSDASFSHRVVNRGCGLIVARLDA